MLTQSERAQIFAMRLAQALNDAKLTVLDINISPIYLSGEILPPLNEIIRIAIPLTSTTTVLEPAPFHSFSNIPHTLLNVTFSDISILHEKASITGESEK